MKYLTIPLLFVCVGLSGQINTNSINSTDSLEFFEKASGKKIAEIDSTDWMTFFDGTTAKSMKERLDDTTTLNEAMQDVDSIQVNDDGVFALPRHSSNPTAVRTGQEYYNTTSDEIRHWNGASWIVGAGDVSVSGTPIDNQIVIWVDATTVEGNANLTFTPSVGGGFITVGDDTDAHIDVLGYGGILVHNESDGQPLIAFNYSTTASDGSGLRYYRLGGTIASPAASPTDGIVKSEDYYVNDGTSNVLAGSHIFEVDGSIATGDFDTKYDWYLKEGAGASALAMTLDVNGLAIEALISTQISASLTDGTPTDAEIDSATGSTPSGVGAGYMVTIKDSDGTGLLYKIESDGTDWYYIAMTKAL